MSYELIRNLPNSGIFWKLTKEQEDCLIRILKNKGLRIGSKQEKSTDSNIAWYPSGYCNYIKNKTSLSTYKFTDYFRESIFTPLIFN